jgi:hypothetical protein
MSIMDMFKLTALILAFLWPGSMLILLSFGGFSTVLAYTRAVAIHERNRRTFQEFLEEPKDYCVEIGWRMAAEDLGYMGDRE